MDEGAHDQTAREGSRCLICGWPLQDGIEKGCTADSCSYRPPEGSVEYQRIKRRREALNAAGPLPKLAGNQNVRDTKSGRFAPETERNNPERVVETDGEKANRSPLERAAVEAIAWLGVARSEEELNLWFADYIQTGCELRGKRLRELTEARITDPYDPRCTPEG